MGKSSKRTIDEATAPASDAPAAAMEVDSPSKPAKKSKKDKKDKAAVDGDDAPEATAAELAPIAQPLGASCRSLPPTRWTSRLDPVLLLLPHSRSCPSCSGQEDGQARPQARQAGCVPRSSLSRRACTG